MPINWKALAAIAKIGAAVGNGVLPPAVAAGVRAAATEIEREAERTGKTSEEFMAELDDQFPAVAAGLDRFVEELEAGT